MGDTRGYLSDAAMEKVGDDKYVGDISELAPPPPRTSFASSANVEGARLQRYCFDILILENNEAMLSGIRISDYGKFWSSIAKLQIR